MPRRLREYSESGIYHVMLRGINRQDIFECPDDYQMFLNILVHLVDRHGEDGAKLPPLCTFYAYCLMNNHVHLLIRERKENISEIMKRIGVSYARYYNGKYERNGALFEDRFRSEAVNSMEYFMKLLQYIHQNPVKSGIAREVSDYQWSSWSEYEGRPGLKICDTYSVLKRLDAENVYEWVTMPVNDDYILDIDSKTSSMITDDELKSYIIGTTGLTTSQDVSVLPKEVRNRILKDLCNYGASVRQIARVTSVAYGVVYRIDKKS